VKKPFLAAALLCLPFAAALAIDITTLKPQGYVSDFAGVVDAASRQQLEQYCASLEQSSGIQLAIVTLPSLNGEPVDQVANDLFRKWGIGQKGANNGILLLLSIGDRRSRLELGYGIEPAITDGMAGDVLRSMAPYLRAGRYGDALLEATAAIGTRIAQAKDALPAVPAPQPRHRRPREPSLPFGVIAGGIVIFFVLSGLFGGGRGGRGAGGSGMGGFLVGMLLGNLMRGGLGGRGGGGFGGFDSGGGGFGGFGGGDSGGGGASGSW
jgi:uncharacterized protein